MSSSPLQQTLIRTSTLGTGMESSPRPSRVFLNKQTSCGTSPAEYPLSNTALMYDAQPGTLEHPMDNIDYHGHALNSDHALSPPPDSTELRGNSPPSRTPIFMACTNCRVIKKKCAVGDPCDPCIQKGKARTCNRPTKRASGQLGAPNQGTYFRPFFLEMSASTPYVAGTEPIPGAAPVAPTNNFSPSTSSQVGRNGARDLPCYCPKHGYTYTEEKNVTHADYTAGNSTLNWQIMNESEPARGPAYPQGHQWVDLIPNTMTYINSQSLDSRGPHTHNEYTTNTTESYEATSAVSTRPFPSCYY